MLQSCLCLTLSLPFLQNASLVSMSMSSDFDEFFVSTARETSESNSAVNLSWTLLQPWLFRSFFTATTTAPEEPDAPAAWLATSSAMGTMMSLGVAEDLSHRLPFDKVGCRKSVWVGVDGWM